MSECIPIYQPQIIRETAEGLNRLDVRDEMLSHRELELTSAVDAQSCATIIRGLLYLQRCDANAPVTLYINSPGGELPCPHRLPGHGGEHGSAAVHRGRRAADAAPQPRHDPRSAH